MKRNLLILLALVAFSCLAVPVMADTIEFSICDGNSDLDAKVSTYPPPYATVKITVPTGGGIATFEVTALDSYTFGGNNGFVANFSEALATTDPVIFVSELPTTANAFSYTHSSGGGNVSEFGTFHDFIEQGNMSEPATYLMFTVDPADHSFANAASVLSINTDGYYIAMHIKLPDSAGTTGYAGDCGPVPLPGAVLLLGAGLARLVAYARRREDA
jgi:hypothetical protein